VLPFWIWYWTHSPAVTPVRVFDYPFVCGACGASCPARVAQQGVGVASPLHGIFGGAKAEAERLAETSVEPLAAAAFAASACPSCHRFPQALTDAAESGSRRSVAWEIWKGTWAKPAAIALVIGLIGAVYDWSGWLALAVVGAVMTLSAGVFLATAAGTKTQGRVDQPPNVAFFWQDVWYTPQVSYTPGGRFQSELKYAWFLIPAFAVGMGLVAVPGVRWYKTFSHLRVLNTNPSGEAIRIRLDGKDLGSVPASVEGDDFGNRSFLFRVGSHHVTAYSASGEVLVDRDFVTSLGHDEVLAPEAAEHDVCVFVVTTTYGRHPQTPERAVQEVIEEIPYIGDVWQASPDKGKDYEERVSLRARRCRPMATRAP